MAVREKAAILSQRHTLSRLRHPPRLPRAAVVDTAGPWPDSACLDWVADTSEKQVSEERNQSNASKTHRLLWYLHALLHSIRLRVVHVRIKHLLLPSVLLTARHGWRIHACLLLVLRLLRHLMLHARIVLAHVLLLRLLRHTSSGSCGRARRGIRHSVGAHRRELRPPLVLGSRVFSWYDIDQEVEHVALGECAGYIASLQGPTLIFFCVYPCAHRKLRDEDIAAFRE